MIININSASAYSPALTAATKPKDESVVAPTKSDEPVSLTVKMSGDGAMAGAAETSKATTPKEQMIEQLKEQIEQVQKQLQQQQAQLAAIQNSKGSEQDKAQRMMALQQQIAGTLAQLTALQGALMQAITTPSVDTTA